jgi:hypothetical protein
MRLRNRIAAWSVALCGLALGGCATVSVSTDFDRAVDFSRYHTFQIVGGHLMHEGVPDDGNTLVKGRIEAALRAGLQARGLREAQADADLNVGYYGGARTRTEIEGMPAYGPGPGFGPFWGPGWWGPTYNDWWARTYNEGTLIIDLVDARTKRLIWRAYAQTEIEVPVSEQKIREAVDKAFQNFPPHK